MEFKLKRRFPGDFSLLGVMLFSSVIYLACDKGLDPNFFKGTIKGRITLDKKLPVKTDEIRVYALKNLALDPVGLLEAENSGKLPLSTTAEQQETTFEIEVPLTSFSAVVALWKEADKSLNPFDAVATYCDENGFIPVELTEGNLTADIGTLDFDVRNINRIAKVRVNVQFEGDWPSGVFLLALTFDDEGAGPITLCSPPDIRLLSLPAIQQNRSLSGTFTVAPRSTLIRVVKATSFDNFETIGQQIITVTEADTTKAAIADTIFANFDNSINF